MDDDDGRVSTPLLSPTEEAGAPLITADTVPDNAGEGSEDGGHDPDANAACCYCGDLDKIEAPAVAPDPSFFGRKTIGLIGGIVLVVNNVAGPGMLAFPQVYQQAGWVPSSVAMVVISTLSAAAGCFFCDAFAALPGNHGKVTAPDDGGEAATGGKATGGGSGGGALVATFSQRAEFCEPFRHHFGGRIELVMHVAFYLTVLCQNIASIVETAQVMDSLVAFICGESWAIEILPEMRIVTWREDSCETETCTPFANDGGYGLILTFGYALSFAALMPLGLLPLDENMPFQVFSFVGLVLGVLEFVVQFANRGLVSTRVPAFGNDYSGVIGTTLFNFAFCVTLPSWLNEAAPGVPISRVIWGSTLGSAAAFVALGIAGGMAYDDVAPNVLTTLSSPSQTNLTRVSAYIFCYLIVGLGVPLFCIYARYNLAASRRVSPTVATLLGVAFPWAVSWMLYQGSLALLFVNWSGIFVNGFCDFFAPLAVALVAAGGTLSLGGVLDALRGPRGAVPRGKTFLEPLPDAVRPWHLNVIAALLLLVGPIVALAIASQFYQAS